VRAAAARAPRSELTAACPCAVTVCDELDDQQRCDQTVLNGTNCHWCSSSLVPPACYSEAQALQLPAAFSCDWNHCATITQRAVCDAAHDSSETPCHWCRVIDSEDERDRLPLSGRALRLDSAARTAFCVNDTTAHALPPSVFKCDNV
jgi:hypothetical protein